MGAANALRAYHGWRGSALKDRSMRLLIYMALIARDHDAEPWYGLGHADLAVMALGLELPADNGNPQDRAKRDAVLRKVRRHITPLLEAGAIEVKHRATYGALGAKHVVYRLHLDGPFRPVPLTGTGRRGPAGTSSAAATGTRSATARQRGRRSIYAA